MLSIDRPEYIGTSGVSNYLAVSPVTKKKNLYINITFSFPPSIYYWIWQAFARLRQPNEKEVHLKAHWLSRCNGNGDLV